MIRRRSTPPPKYWLFACKSVAGHISYSVVGSIRPCSRRVVVRALQHCMVVEFLPLNDENALPRLSVKPFLHQHASDSTLKQRKIQLKQCHSRTFSKVRQTKLHFHGITPTQFSNSLWKPKKVEKEKKIFGNDDLHSKTPKLLVNPLTFLSLP